MLLLLHMLQLLLLIGSTAQERLRMQKGPLYRTEGSQIMIWCHAQGYPVRPKPTFEWSVYLPSAPSHKIRISSTEDQYFPDTSFRERVYNGTIYVEHIKHDLTVLTILSIQTHDTGEYECQAKFMDDYPFGHHSATTKVIVIPETLQVVAAPATFNKVEGGSLELKCDVSSRTAHDIRLFNVSWLHRQEGEEGYKVILVLPKNRRVSPGPEYAQRFNAGNIQLDKMGDTTYKLMMRNLQPSDQGEYFCVAVEWTLDPDGSLYYLSGKWSGGMIVNVQTKGVSAPNTEHGSTVSLYCQPPLDNVTIALVTASPCHIPNTVVFPESNAYLTEPFEENFTLKQTYELTIRTLECSTAGDYCCVFTNFPPIHQDRRIFLEITGCNEN